MTKIIFLKDARPLCGEFLKVTERYSSISMTTIRETMALGEIEKRNSYLKFTDHRSNIAKRFKLNQFQEAIDYGLELFRERNKRSNSIRNNLKF